MRITALSRSLMAVTLLAGCTTARALAQAATPETKTGPGIDRRSHQQLEEQATSMLADALKSPSGIASVTLEKYPGHSTMLTVRTKPGGAEMHAQWNDIFFVLDGEATELVGGTIVDPKSAPGGETRGTRVEGGTPTPMRKGDVIHISPNTPHQTVVAPGKTFTYYVIKVAAPTS